MFSSQRISALLLCFVAFAVAMVPHELILDEQGFIANGQAYDHYKLPTSLRPIFYRLQIVTHLENPANLFFEGEVAIQLAVLEDTNNITLHSQNLTIDSSKIRLDNGKQSDNCIKSVELNNKHDYYIMQLCKPLQKGESYNLNIPFEAPLNAKLYGYYKSSYLDRATNETRWLSITQFEPASARAAFPCFDEPQLKAKFTIILGHMKKYSALSNMALKETRPMGEQTEWIWSEFEESVPMSTYLVAYSINDFANVKAETQLKSNVQFRTWARRDAIEQCGYAGEVGPKVLQFYEDIFQIKFPLEKIDQIAIPDFSAGAMENWGLVTYRETALLYAKNVSSAANKQRVAEVIAHELAHQWFGNLVTMKWWTDLWLNEGFATYVASLGLEHINPEWKSLEEESVANTLHIFKLDALKSSHPISQHIEHASQIAQIFDSISYKKGSAVLRMMHLFMGDESFQNGIYLYLKKHAYDNAEQDNLWSALTVAAHKAKTIPSEYDIKRIMDSWTLQTGYPFITVTRDYKTNTAQVIQERYILDTNSTLGKTSNSCWWVPLSYTTQKEGDFKNTMPRAWLECGAQNEIIPKKITDLPGENEWIMFNVQLAGLYKVKYDEQNWNLLIATLMSDEYGRIHVVNRAQLIDDALSLAWSANLDYEVAMRLVDYLVRETEYIPWKAALENLANVNRILRQTPEYEFFKKYMRKILSPIYCHLNGLNATSNMDSENHSSILHKTLVASWACRFEVEDCVSRAQEYFKQWRETSNPDKSNPVPVDLRSVVYCTAMRHGNDEDWEFLWARYRNSNVAAEQKTIITSLGCSREIWILQRYLERAFDDASYIRKQDSMFAFGSVARGEVGFHLARDYYLTNIDFLHDFYGPDSNEFARLLTPLASQMISNREYETVKNFTEKHKLILQKSELIVRRALETIQINAQWKEQNYNAISAQLKSLL